MAELRAAGTITSMASFRTARRRFVLLALTLVTLTVALVPSALAQRLEIIDLQHRPAQEVIPLLRPFLAEGGTLTGQRGQLFIRTTPRNLAELKRLLTTIDRAAAQLVITVLQGEALKLAEDDAALSARLGVGGRGRITAGEPSTSRESVELRVRRTRSRHRGEEVQRVRVTEGGTATIYVGQATPLGSRSTTRSPWGTQTTDSIEYRNVTTGVRVRPRLNGERVTLDIRARRDAMASTGGGRIDVQGVETTVSGELGEWIALGGIAEEEMRRERGIIRRSSGTRETRGRVLLRVEKVPERDNP